MGCLKALVAQVGCLLVLVAAVVLAFVFRRPLYDAYRRWRGERPAAAVAYAAPEAAGGRSAAEALARLGQPGGPAYVDLTAAEIAALLDRDLVQASRRVFDSVEVALDSDVILVRGMLDLSRLPHDLLGPFASSFTGYEPVEAGGALVAAPGGGVQWRPDRLRINDLPIPRKGIPALLRELHFEAGRGGVALPGLGAVGDVRVSPEHVRLYRLERR